MESIIERIEKNHFWKFSGGIHPPQQKFLSNDKPIKTIELANELILPLKQHIGKAGEVIVHVGDRVLKGQPLTHNDTPMSVPIHAPTSGIVSAIKNSTIAHPSGMAELCLMIKPDGLDQWRERHIVDDFYRLSKAELIDKITCAGIAGMGGAGFPTNIKVSAKPGIKFLIINAAECEPYITADDLLMREHSAAVINGIDILTVLLEPEKILIGIEDNKPQAIAALKAATLDKDNVHVCVLPTKYPTGGEKQLIKALTGEEVPSGVHPLAIGMVVQNVATAFAISEAVINDTPLIRRVVTVTGQAVKKPQNIWVPLGTPVAHVLKQCGFAEPEQAEQQRVIMGGPLMGFTLPTLNVPVVKISNCILVPTIAEIAPVTNEVECIRCGQCAEVCPSSLLPQELQWHAKAKDFDKLEQLNLFDCIDCGACAYVCPSQIPLVQYYRVAKAEIRHNKIQEAKAEKAKIRFEARQVRLEKEKQAREEKHQKAMTARKAATSPEKAQANNSAVAAALARVKAKKAAQASAGDTTTAADTDVKTRAAQAIARAKAKKAAATSSNKVQADADKPAEALTAAEQKKARTAVAIAKAKAKKQAAKAENIEQNKNANQAELGLDSETNIELSANEQKKAKIAAAVAKVKAKANQQNVEHPEQAVSDADKKAKIAKAIAKAKAKKLKEQESK
ncbi:electron transport complex subunit RsxC [Thalassotalea sp. 42_200_T64]|nr:electron transport complex subunit RsxC [Thalassotalea sp. 42_200_T64]